MTIQTTAGAVRAGDLGFTSMHEHVACWFSLGVRDNYLWDPQSDAREIALAEAVRKVAAGRDAGIDAIVDLTTVDIGRDVPFIAEVSKRTGVSVVVSAGLFARSPPGAWSYFQTLGIDGTAKLMIRDIEEGVMGTGVRAGVIKAAMAPPGFAAIGPVATEMANDLKVLPKSHWGVFSLRVAARTHLRTGALINVHSYTGFKTGIDTCDILEEEGVDLSRLLIHHVGDTHDFDYLHAMLARGACLSMDPHRGPWRYDTIAQLCAEGFADRLTLGIDSVQVADWDGINAFEGEERARLEREWAMEYLPLEVVPRLRAAGASEEAIRAMTVSNPARLMEFTLKTAAPDQPVETGATSTHAARIRELAMAEAAIDPERPVTPAPVRPKTPHCGLDNCSHDH